MTVERTAHNASNALGVLTPTAFAIDLEHTVRVGRGAGTTDIEIDLDTTRWYINDYLLGPSATSITSFSKLARAASTWGHAAPTSPLATFPSRGLRRRAPNVAQADVARPWATPPRSRA